MSRGPGRLQRFALVLLAEVEELSAEELAATYAAHLGRGAYGESNLRGARRALRRLAETGRAEVVRQSDGRRVGYRSRKES